MLGLKPYTITLHHQYREPITVNIRARNTDHAEAKAWRNYRFDQWVAATIDGPDGIRTVAAPDEIAGR